MKCSKIIQWSKLFSVDILLLQETFLSSLSDYKHFKDNWGGQVLFSPSVSNLSGGVCIAFSNRFPFVVSDVKRDVNGRCISVLCSVNNFSFKICNVHAPNVPNERKVFLNDLYFYVRGSDPLIIGGDFNCVLDASDRVTLSNSTSSFIGRREIKELISTFNLKDASSALHAFPGHTRFCRNSGQSSRIDRIYIANAFTAIKAHTVDIPFSDHIPVYVTMKLPCNVSRKRSYWKYNVSLSLDEQFCKDFLFHYDKWSSLKPAFRSIVEWWENIKVRIKELSIKHGVRIAQEKRKMLLERQALLSNSSPDDIDNLLRSEVEGALIRSRVKYLEDGEKPSSFFFKQESRKASQKIIHSVRNNSGDIVTDDNDIACVFHNFYSNLFSREDNVDHNMQNEFIKFLSVTVDPSDKMNLDGPISLEEVKAALMNMSNNKSPGLDGIPYELYRKFFDIMGNDLTDVYNGIFLRALFLSHNALLLFL
ncbi:hypothetical protein HOLleu_43296 [Holothuria leucospilota]|uniref:Endonuclease/exonuclease/phosphatase domain-containing protein n=1 Tax=Holothuria leucospilota TaxID=206669 RepID=A0A9Q0Y9M4_HOLLE|nr:hypothetical protein HOLleu_43296 [Holothuria leucospilota]